MNLSTNTERCDVIERVCIPLFEFAIFTPCEEHVGLGDKLYTHNAEKIQYNRKFHPTYLFGSK